MMMMGRGDLQVCSLIPEADLLTREREREVSEGGMLSCGSSRWNVAEKEAEKEAEEAAVEIVNRLRPTRHAHQRRAQVMEYVQRLIKSSLGFEAFPYGSVPLKTFLPDGDVDLTIITTPTIEDAAVSDVHAVLREAEQNGDSPYQVKDVHCIDAEVKLIKCIVQDIVVDISFNQLGGLCTLCFLEQVDQLVGKNHLFKRSIILIKAWCYYESRILGAHHGLISTYALETLVLYIFNLFHSSLSEPLAVLHRFLEYFGNFDWQSYCVCLNGPVCISSLPDIVVEPPENGGIKPLLSDEFLDQCVEMFSIPSTNVERSSQAFLHKYLNIIDPLKEYNNLGRSVNRANFYRIRSAFKLGAHKLGQILLLPRGRIGSKLNEFFVNSLERNGSNHWTLMENYALVSIASNSDDTAPSHSDTISEDDVLRKPTAGQNKDRNSGALSLENSCSASYFRGENEEGANRVRCGEMLQNVFTCNEISCASTPEPKESQSVNNDAVAPFSSMQPTAADTSPEKRTGDYRSFKILLDLGGDLETHYRSVVYSQYCSSYAVSATVLPAPRILPLSQIKNAWKTVRQSLQLKWIVHSQLNSSGTMAPQYCSGKPPETVGAVNPEDKKRRGTGTYIPNMRYHSNRDGFSSGRGSNQAPGTIGRWHEQNHGNACAATSEEEIVSENGHELVLSEVEYPRLGNGKHIASDAHQSYPSMWGYSSANGFYSLPARFDSGKSGHQPEEEPLPVTMVLPDAAALCDSGSTSCPQATVITCPEQVSELEHEGVPLHSYHLKDEVDFPPLPHSKAIET